MNILMVVDKHHEYIVFKDGFEPFIKKLEDRGHKVKFIIVTGNDPVKIINEFKPDWVLYSMHTNLGTVNFMKPIFDANIKTAYFPHDLFQVMDDISFAEKADLVFQCTRPSISHFKKKKFKYVDWWKFELKSGLKRDPKLVTIIEEMAVPPNHYHRVSRTHQLPFLEMAEYLESHGYKVKIKGIDKVHCFEGRNTEYFCSQGVIDAGTESSFVIGCGSSVLVEAARLGAIPIHVDHINDTGIELNPWKQDTLVNDVVRHLYVASPLRLHRVKAIASWFPGITKKLETPDILTKMKELENPEKRQQVLDVLNDFWFSGSPPPFSDTVISELEKFEKPKHLVIDMLDHGMSPCKNALKDISLKIKPDSYLEVGVSEGDSLKVVLESADIKRLALCDAWGREYEGSGRGNHDHISNMLNKMKFSGEILFLDGDSKYQLHTVEEKYKLILLDGDCSYMGAMIDLHNAWNLLEKDGFLVLNNIINPNYRDLYKCAMDFAASVGAPILYKNDKNANGFIVYMKVL